MRRWSSSFPLLAFLPVPAGTFPVRRWFRAMFVKARPVLQMPPAKFAAFVYDDFCAAFRAVLKRVLASFFLPVIRVDLDSLPVLNMDSALVADKFVAI